MTATCLKPAAGQNSGAIQTSPANVGLQTTDRTVLADQILRGGAPLDVGSLIGLDVGNNACVVAERLVATGVKVGYRWQGMQFASLRDLKAWNCGVGFYSKPIPDAGGNNSISLYDPQAIGCLVGALFVMPPNAQHPNNAIYLRNFTALDNKVCGLAAIGRPGMPLVLTVDGGAPEDTDKACAGPASYTYDGFTVPKCSVYGSNAHLRLRAGERRRVVHVVPAMQATAPVYVVFPQGSGSQATLRFSNWQTFFPASDNPASRAIASQILRGGVSVR